VANRPVAACILAKHYNSSTERAIYSALKFDLEVYLGLTHDNIDLCTQTNIHVFSICWENDFAKAKNSFFSRVKNPFILWIDSDEELFSFPKIDWNKLQENIFYIRHQFNSRFTPRICSQMHRNHPDIFWERKIHEYITTKHDALYLSRFLSSVVIRHHGYEDQTTMMQKHARNLHIAESDEQHEKSYVVNLVRLRNELASGQFDFLAWLNCYAWAKRETNLNRAVTHHEFEPALRLCMAGYARPAQECALINPTHILIQLALLTYDYKYNKKIDEDRLLFIETCLTEGLYDVYEDLPHTLLGADANKILSYIKVWANEWKDSVMNNYEWVEQKEIIFNNNIQLIRNDCISEENFHPDVLLMNMETKKVVVLNTASSILWQMLAPTIAWYELHEILQQVYPPALLNDAINSSKALFNVLLAAGIIRVEENVNEAASSLIGLAE